ncbi:universal stress protein [Halorhabdus sp. CBA1104]|uniref:universal stress protein n=1 Tax=unclassified Halorhabdus TaxID=2621901 RepID=UPI0012B22CE3|nr:MULTISPECIES: universal stress protein [unclassified Halorhabdus]QGN08088.1 universal stress protein [Halorhabdus sp. CBA1104]
MEQGLFVVIERSDAEQELLAEAAAFSECEDSPLVVLRLLTSEDVEAVESTELTSDIDRAQFEDPVDHQFEEETTAFVEDSLDGAEPTHEVDIRIGSEGDRARAILDAAADHDCDHVFLVGKRRSPTGKALFGDLTQEIILDFDGSITLSME